MVALTFALDAGRVGVPVELVHDWTLGYFHKRWDEGERRVLERMKRADRVKCLYPASSEYLRGKGVEVEYVGLPVDEPPEGIVRRDDGKRHAVVFAPANHRENLEACGEMDGYDVIDVIGRDGKDEGKFRFHGYLDKDDADERRRYWEILMGAECVIAMGRSWPGGSSIAEAKACGCRVRTRGWPDLRDISGESGK